MREYFGSCGAGGSSPCAQGSLLYDIGNDLIADALIEPISVDERTLAKRHIEKLVEMESFGRELILFDRGYASKELIELLEPVQNLKNPVGVQGIAAEILLAQPKDWSEKPGFWRESAKNAPKF